jgi:hypothetical protein
VIFNELAQWAVIGFLGVFVLGLTRQLGNFLVPARAQTEASAPPVGSTIPDGLLPEAERRQLRGLFAERGSECAALIAVEPQCEFCDALLTELSRDGVPDGVPLVIVGESTGAEDAELLSGLADIVIDDPGRKRAKRAGLSVAPFVLLVDRELAVLHRQAGGSVRQAMQRAGVGPMEVVSVDAAPANGNGDRQHAPILGARERSTT